MYVQNRNRFTDVENKPVVPKGERETGRNTSGYGMGTYKLLYMKQIGLPQRFSSKGSACQCRRQEFDL